MNEKKQIIFFKISHAMHGLLTSSNIVSSFFKTGVHHQKQGFQKNFSKCKHYKQLRETPSLNLTSKPKRKISRRMPPITQKTSKQVHAKEPPRG